MYVLDGEWSDGYLDYHCGTGQTRIKVSTWQVLDVVDDLYIIRSSNVSMLFNYVVEVGAVEVARKIVSRKRERLRNRKYISAGCGVVVDTGGTTFAPGDRVVFLAPSHPRCVDHIALDDRLIAPAYSVPAVEGGDASIRYHDMPLSAGAGCSRFAGWSEFSGGDFDADAIRTCLRELEAAMAQPDRVPTRVLPAPPRPVAERSTAPSDTRRPDRLTATLFGLGNYAKTIILPNLDRRIVVENVHEIDPTQIGRPASLGYAADTSPLLRDDERPDVVFIAGFHHTHADLAVQAIERGAVAVVEKPLVTRPDQLDRLCRALESTGGRLYAGFHKRYSPFNPYIISDLALTADAPVSCHCIVYEIPLPSRHWYEWPNSGSRIVSNGCHWIDHFLFLNGYSEVVRNFVVRTRSGDFVVSLELENGASFSMTLTDTGSARIGVQEHVEFRANGRTARIVNASRYDAESGSRILRRKTTHKYASFRNMYRSISSRIVEGETGDSMTSIVMSSRVMLNLEQELRPGSFGPISPANA